jgi:DNA-binding transcriptional regulator YdaS (Cro superfamily)
MSGPPPNTSTPLGRLLVDVGMQTGDLARALDMSVTSVKDWCNGRNRISRDRVERIVEVLAGRGVNADRARRALVSQTSKRQPPLVLAASWGGGMPYDWFLARRMEAEGLEEAA